MEYIDYCNAIYGRSPWKWQEQMAGLLKNLQWHDKLILPPAAGKTSILDLWYYALFCDSQRNTRGIPLRFFYITDRKFLVDAAYTLARQLARAMSQPALQPVAEAVCHRFNVQTPLVVGHLRSGLDRSEKNAWISTPNQPTIIISTVDQFGSRLLFNGYGVSSKVRPIHAGLAAVDSLLVVDEAHLSPAIVETSRKVYGSLTKGLLGDVPPSRVIELSATQRKGGTVFPVTIQNDPELVRRSKVEKMVMLKKTGEDQTFVKTIVEEALAAVKAEPRTKLVALVVNTVTKARAVHTELSKRAKADVRLLIGRVRNHERQALQQACQPFLSPNRRKGDEPLTYVVATQVVEVGADFDFDTVLSESAPLDCIVQRFGRMDRVARRPFPLRGLILHDSAQDADPVYEETAGKTFDFLSKAASAVDVNKIEGLGTQKERDSLFTKSNRVPPLLPKTWEMLAWTNRDMNITVDALLHGVADRPNNDVTLIYRSDITADMLQADADTGSKVAERCVRLIPPNNQEMFNVSRSCFYERTAVADVEQSFAEAPPPSSRGRLLDRLCLRYRDYAVVKIRDVRPGDLIFVPSEFGCHDEWGWNSNSTEPVKDVADFYGTRVRLNASLPGLDLTAYEEDGAYDLDAIIDHVMEEVLPNLAESDLARATAIKKKFVKHRDGYRWAYRQTPDNASLVLHAYQVKQKGAIETLEDHSEKVAKAAVQIAKGVGLRAEYVRLLEQVARYHDLGKAHPAFQEVLYGGLADPSVVIAKSFKDHNRRMRPKGWRHEALSVQLVKENKLGDDPLLHHLILSHHGHCRPFPVTVRDRRFRPMEFTYGGKTLTAAEDYSAGIHDIERFCDLTQQFGPWGLAFLESVFRLADGKVSKEAQR